MIRKSLVLMFLLSVMTLLSAGDFVIGTGTSTTTNIPFYGYNDFGWSKFFFTSSELSAVGMVGTESITKIALQLGGTPLVNYVTENQYVYFRYFYDSSYGSTANNYPGTAGFTLVYNGSITWNGPGWVEIPLLAPYSHNSAYGIEILWENRDGSRLAGPPKFCYTNTSVYQAVYKNQNTTFPTTTGTRTYSRPNFWFMTPPTDVPPPAVAVSPADLATGIEINSALTWNHTGGSPDSYLLWLGTDNPPSNIVSAYYTTSNSYLPPQYLEYETTYYWRVVPHNSFGYALACPVWSFTTKQDPTIYTFPWTENFDGTFKPQGWTDHAGGLTDPIVLGADGSSQWMQDDWLNIASTDKAARMNIWGTVQGWFISPLLNINDDQYLVFDAALLKYGQPPTGTPPALTGIDDRFAVLIGDGFTWTTANILREWNNSGSEYVLNEIPVTGATYKLSLAGHSGRKRIAFFTGSTVSNADNDFMINNVQVKEMLETPLVEIELDPVLQQLTLSWDSITNATHYEIYKASAPDATFTLLDTTSSTQYQISSQDAKAFFKIIATNTPD